jgi:hypothetical protein
VAVATLLWGTAPLSWAAAEGGSVGASKAPVISGTIASINPQQKTLTVDRGLLPDREFMVDAQTKITDGQRSLQLDQLQPNSPVTVQYVEEDGERTAQSITVKAASSPQPGR